MDATVIVFAGVATLAAACLFGLLPALHASRDQTGARRRARAQLRSRTRPRAEHARRHRDLARGGAARRRPGLLGRNFVALVRTPLGIDPRGVQTISLSLPSATYKDLDRRAYFVERVLANAATRPDVEAAGAIFGCR